MSFAIAKTNHLQSPSKLIFEQRNIKSVSAKHGIKTVEKLQYLNRNKSAIDLNSFHSIHSSLGHTLMHIVRRLKSD